MFLKMFCEYKKFLPSTHCTCFATNYQTTSSKIFPERPMIIVQLARNSLPLRRSRLITVSKKASQCNSYYEPRECNSYALLQGSSCHEKKKKERQDCHLCGPYVKMFIYYLNRRLNTEASRCESHTLVFRVNQRFPTIRVPMNFVRSKERVL
jgi:hypothetical protein